MIASIRKFAIVAGLASLMWAAPALSQEAGQAARSSGEVSKITMEVTQEIYSPFCPGKTLAMCPSGKASDVRQDIQSLAAEGKDRQAIKEAVIARYGEEFRMVEPPAQDNYTLLGVLAAAFGLCLFAIWFLAGRRRGGAGDDGPEDVEASTDGDLSDEEQAYLDELRGEYMD